MRITAIRLFQWQPAETRASPGNNHRYSNSRRAPHRQSFETMPPPLRCTTGTCSIYLSHSIWFSPENLVARQHDHRIDGLLCTQWAIFLSNCSTAGCCTRTGRTARAVSDDPFLKIVCRHSPAAAENNSVAGNSIKPFIDGTAHAAVGGRPAASNRTASPVHPFAGIHSWPI